MQTQIALYVLVSVLWGGVRALAENEYVYSISRDQLIQAEKAFQGRTTELSPAEQVADRYLQYLKWREFQTTKLSGFPPSRPIEQVLPHILNSTVYRVLRPLPKGGNMHTHQDHQVGRKLFLDILFGSEDFEHFYITDETSSNPWRLDFFINPPAGQGWVKVKDSPQYTKDFIYEKLTLINIMNDTARRYPTDSGLRWRSINPLWTRAGSGLLNNIAIERRYLEVLMETSLDEGVQYLETRKKFGGLYSLDRSGNHSATYGKQVLDPNGDLEVNITMEATETFIRNNPSFIGFKSVAYTTRTIDATTLQKNLDNIARLHQNNPSYVVGFDVVAEEDAGRSHLFFLSNLLSVRDENAENGVRVPLLLHTGETNWDDELITSEDPMDPVATLQNTYESVLLGSRRIAHGLGFSRHPYLLQLLKERDVAIESCPVSNQILGMTPDLRTHPAVGYIRSGVPVVLGSDDAGTFGHDHFTVDWYEAFMAWGLGLADLKQLALNSLKYSSMSSTEKVTAVEDKWRPAWQIYIDNLRQEACQADVTQGQPIFSRMLPADGARVGGTRVHVFGRHFERAICHNITCRFGAIESTSAVYISNTHITCESPDLPNPTLLEAIQSNGVELSHRQAVILLRLMDESPPRPPFAFKPPAVTVPVAVSLDGGATFYETGHNFTYMYEPKAGPNTSTVEVNSGIRVTRVSLWPILMTCYLIIANVALPSH